MAEIVYSRRFRKDVKLCRKQGKDMGKLREIFDIMLSGQSIPPRYKDHALVGKWKGFRDVHLEPDWVLVYCMEKDTIYLSATGSHSDLLKV
jgi:mRNA interferase YafQ